MHRDMDLIREILLKIEELPYDGGFRPIEIEGRASYEIAYHVMILAEARLIEAQNVTTHDGIDWRPKRLTYAGHEFLDAAKSQQDMATGLAVASQQHRNNHARRVENGFARNDKAVAAIAPTLQTATGRGISYRLKRKGFIHGSAFHAGA